MQTNLLTLGGFGKVLSRIHFANDLYTLYNRLNGSRLSRFRKKKHVKVGKSEDKHPKYRGSVKHLQRKYRRGQKFDLELKLL